MNQLISDGGDCKTAPATPGLLITLESASVVSICSVLSDLLKSFYHLTY